MLFPDNREEEMQSQKYQADISTFLNPNQGETCVSLIVKEAYASPRVLLDRQVPRDPQGTIRGSGPGWGGG